MTNTNNPSSASTIRYPLLSYGSRREMETYQQQGEIVKRHLLAISIYGSVGGRQIYGLWAFMSVRVAVQTFFFSQSLGVDETNRTKMRNLNLKSQLSSIYIFRDHSVHTSRRTWRDGLV